jgi:hypothetical protein
VVGTPLREAPTLVDNVIVVVVAALEVDNVESGFVRLTVVDGVGNLVVTMVHIVSAHEQLDVTSLLEQFKQLMASPADCKLQDCMPLNVAGIVPVSRFPFTYLKSPL